MDHVDVNLIYFGKTLKNIARINTNKCFKNYPETEQNSRFKAFSLNALYLASSP